MLKVEASVLPNGMAINVTSAVPGSVADITICESNIDFHASHLVKASSELQLHDDGRLLDAYPGSWALLADKGYQGLHRRVRAITPAKRPAGGLLSFDDLSQNDKIASDRVIVENIFGRLKTLWAITSDCYRWKRDHYDLFFQTCVALTNVHIRFLPLREEDGYDLNRYVHRLLSIGERTKSRRTGSMAKYREKRKQRLGALLPRGEILQYGSEMDYYDSADDSGIFD